MRFMPPSALRQQLARLRRRGLTRAGSARAAVIASGLWDEAWFVRQYRDQLAGREPLDWFLRDAAARALQPNALFDTAYYLHAHPEARRTNPLLHYLRRSARAGYRPNALFDPDWYAERHPDAAITGRDPLWHYLTIGEAEGRQPHPLFDTRWYQRQYPSAIADGGSALGHYLHEGEAAGFRPNPAFDPAAHRAAMTDPPPFGGALLAHVRARAPDTPSADDAPQADPHPALDWYIEDNQERVRSVLGDSTPTPPPRRPRDDQLAVLIVTRDRPEFIEPLLDSLTRARPALAGRGIDLRIVVGDTGSSDPAVLAAYERLGDAIDLVRDLEYHFSRCNNALLERVPEAAEVLFLNNDIALRDPAGTLTAMRAHLRAHPGTGALGAVLRFPDGSVQHEGIEVIADGPLRGFVRHARAGRRVGLRSDQARTFCAATGAALMMRRDALDATGGFDASYRSECQDVDLCLRAARAGFATEVLNAGHIVHHENGTRPRGDADWRDRRQLMRRWSTWIERQWL